jgi:hypothetical protein
MTILSPLERFRKNPQSDWWKGDPSRLDQLKAILARKPIPNVTEIMIEMGAPSRNCIIGKARREGLQLRPPHRTNRPKRVKTKPNRKLYVPRAAIDLPANFIAIEAEERREKARETMLADIAERQAADEAAAQTGGIPFMEIGNGKCRWPLTEVKPLADFRFCGAKCDGVYCAPHTRRSMNRFVAEAAE